MSQKAYINFARCKRSCTAWRISVNGASAISPRATRTKSKPLAICKNSGRTASRKRRFTRLRVTAFPNFFPATNPARECSSPFARIRNITSGWANARPCCHTRCTSDSAFSRHARFTRQHPDLTGFQDDIIRPNTECIINQLVLRQL